MFLSEATYSLDTCKFEIVCANGKRAKQISNNNLPHINWRKSKISQTKVNVSAVVDHGWSWGNVRLQKINKEFCRIYM